jgi:endoglucanase
MNHFVTDDGLNAFRLPVSWQYLTNNVQGGALNANNWAIYDKLVQTCIASGAALCEIDLHNYARWNNKIIGQDAGAPTNAQFATFWGQLAAKYANNQKIAFGVMNEPVSGFSSFPIAAPSDKAGYIYASTEH